tara:strand:+ start:291 stop:728 length:438 start_codon:yes stop_codon:yes gene_type:complete
MTKYVIGCDPGSTKGHGVSVYKDKTLIELHMMKLMELYGLLLALKEDGGVIVHIEDVYSQRGVWHDENGSKKSFGKTSQNVGLCKWAQIEVERMCEHIGVEVVRHKVSKCWKDKNGKVQFEKVTGWAGRSNEDTRSAAYFGFLGL